MDHCKMERAAKLLAKAQSTEYDAEAIALLEKSCRLLTGVIIAADGETRAAGRRVGTLRGPCLERDPAIAYRQPAEDLRPQGKEHIDLTA